jgi:Tol biopolymer transport system component
VTVTAPPRPPRPSDPISREELEALVEALIEEARQRARRRRQKYAAVAGSVALVAAVVLTVIERTTQSQTASPALAAQSTPAAGATSATIAFITGRRTVCANPPGCSRPPLGSDALTGKLYIVNADGSGLRLLAQKASTAAPPAWSPDGQKLAFNRSASGLNSGIYVVNADGSGLQNLTSGWGPAWSPDGRKIAFGRVVKVRWVTPNGPDLDIFVMNADGSGIQNLTTGNPKPEEGPAWSPDGQKIAFGRVVGVVRCGTGGCGPAESDIFVMNADGSGQQNLTRKPTLHLGSPTWSPDGQKILFQRRAKGKNWEIFAINSDGSGLRNLTRSRSHDLDAAWSPDGRRIVFRTSRHGKWELYVMNADGSGQRRLTRTPAANESRPSWSPDGRKIAFTREVGYSFELYVMNADGSGQRRLTPNSPVDRWVAYSWSPAQ